MGQGVASRGLFPWALNKIGELTQEPITRSGQLSFARITAFSRTCLFSERFWCEFEMSFEFHKPVNKTYRPK